MYFRYPYGGNGAKNVIPNLWFYVFYMVDVVWKTTEFLFNV